MAVERCNRAIRPGREELRSQRLAEIVVPEKRHSIFSSKKSETSHSTLEAAELGVV